MPVAQTENAPAMGVAPPLAPEPSPVPRRPPPTTLPPVAHTTLWWATLAAAGLLCFITFYAKGGLNLESMTVTELVLTLGSAVAIAAALLLAPAGRRAFGVWPAALLLAFTLLTVASIVWSVQPDASWRDAGRMFAYSAVFAAAVALARSAPERWPALLGGIVVAAVVVCAYALLTKVLPAQLASSDTHARLEEPYGYWNALGLTAAMGAIACMWLGSRRTGHALLSAMAYPAMGVCLLTLVLAYSRGALAALAVGVVLWFCFVPLRLRSAALLIAAGVGAGAVTAWDFSRHALSSEGVPLSERVSAGHELGALIAAMILALAVVGIVIGFQTGRTPPSRTTRRNAGALLLALVVLAAVAFAGALAHSHRGFTGTISHDVETLTNPNAKVPPNTPGRLTAIASVRARYWKEALQIFSAHPALGAGADGYQIARMRYRNETLEVKHAHGFVVQTLADLGIVGLALALALLLAWMATAGRPTHPFGRRWTGWGTWLRIRSGERPAWQRWREPYGAERVGMLAMLCLVFTFGVHSLVDWTWYVPGDACVALLCAGWLAGRGPLAVPAGAGARSHDARLRLRELTSLGFSRRTLAELGPTRVAMAGAVLVGALLVAWAQWQPQRSEDARQQALALLSHDHSAALASANAAVSRDPLSAEALFALADVEQVRSEPTLARATLQRAVRLQPSNPATWLELGRYDLAHEQPTGALRELEAAIYLNPQSISPEALATEQQAVEIHNDYIQALRGAAAKQG